MNLYYPEFREDFLGVVESLKGKKVAILGHLRPDGDCIGSQIALCRCLRSLGIEAVAIGPDSIPRVLRGFVKDTPFFLAGEFQGKDLISVNVDCADVVRVGKDLQNRFGKTFANIDHHISNQCYGEHNFVHGESSATAEILAGIFFDCRLPIDPISAQALYVGIATDTGQFRFAATSSQVFDICRRLSKSGANPAKAAIELYEQESINKFLLLQRFLASLRFECDGKVCIGFLRDGVYEETGATKDDSEGLVDYTRAINGVQIGILIEERNGAIKGSFRSIDPIHRVDQLAHFFNGGGHACAAGFNYKDTLKSFFPLLVQKLKLHFESLPSS